MPKLRRIVLFALFLIITCTAASCAEGETPLIRGLEDLADKRIAVTTGSVQELYASEHYPNANIFRFSNQADSLAALRSDKVDAVIGSYTSMRDALLIDGSLVFLNERVFDLPVGVAFNKNTPELTAAYNAFLSELEEDGTLADMVERYFEKDNYEMPEIASDNQNGRLTYAAPFDSLPHAGIVNGEFVGIEPELALRFAKYMGVELVIQNADFTGLIASLASGKVDMIGGGIFITEERQRMVDFSDPAYFDYVSVMTTHDKIDPEIISAAQPSGGTQTAGASAYDSEGIASPETFFESLRDSFYRNIILERRYMLVLDGLFATIVLSLMALVFGTALGALVCAMRMAKNRIARNIAKAYISILRGVPVLVILMVIYYIVFASVNIDPFLVAMLAFGMNFAAYVAEMFRTGIEGVDKGQREAGIAGGFTPAQTFMHVILPQAARRILPVYKGEYISLVKMTSVVGYIAVQDLTKAGDIIRSRTMEAFFPLVMVAALYFIISWLLALILSYLERRIDPRRDG